MVDVLRRCHQKGENRMSKTKSPITPGEAAELLQSAVSYCLQAGITVQGYGANGTLFLAFCGLTLEDAPQGMAFAPSEPDAQSTQSTECR